MRRALPACALALFTGCGRLETFAALPPQTPDELLSSLPWVEVGGVIVTQPTSSALVFLAAALSAFLGARTLKRGLGASHLGWGVALLVGGLGAAFAGISYQAFAYELKARGLEFVLWTSWWEIAYLALTFAAGGALLVGVTAAFADERAVVRARVAASLLVVAYLLTLGLGLALEVRFLVSFEGLLAACLPIGGPVAWQAVAAARRGDAAARELLVGGALLTVAVAVHAGWAALGLTDALWARGVWFSENDAFHAAMLGWLAWYGLRFEPRLSRSGAVA